MLTPERTDDQEELVTVIHDFYEVARQALGDADFTFREAIDAPVESLRRIALETEADLLVLGSTHLGATWPRMAGKRGRAPGLATRRAPSSSRPAGMRNAATPASP